jgi:hypothetical protein
MESTFSEALQVLAFLRASILASSGHDPHKGTFWKSGEVKLLAALCAEC